ADWLMTGQPLLLFAGLRTGCIVLGWALWQLSRGRLVYGARVLLLLIPFMFVVEYIMLRYHLINSPYFSGMALVMICATTCMPLRTAFAGPIYLIVVSPVLAWLGLYGA